MRVLLIEDDPVLGESLVEYLNREGINVEWIQDERKLFDLNMMEKFDVVILDLILKFRRGEDILKGIRHKGISTPVLVLTAKSRLEDKEVCFNLGADDYLTKPFEPKELLLRLKALSRRRIPGEVVRIGNAEVLIDAKLIRVEGKEVKLSKTAWELLELLIKNRGRVVSTETILSCIWGDKPVGSEVVRAYIKELRKVLPKGAIETYKGIGYRLV